MMRMSAWQVVPQCIALFATLLGVTASAQTPLGTAFTYQGNLELSGSPVGGTADFQFKLFGAVTGGSQIGSTQSINNVTVVEGSFTVPLDFGAPAFNGDKRWLEIAVRSPAGSGSFVTLTPRQELTPAPYALKVRGVDGHSLDASDGSPSDAVFVDPSGNVGVGTTSPGVKLHVKGADQPIQIDGPATGDANGAWMGFGDANGTVLGYVGDASTQNDGMYLGAYNGLVALYTPAGQVLTATEDGKVGIGRADPNGGLHIMREPATNGGTLTLEGATHTYMSFFPDGAAAGRKAYFGFPGSAFTDLHLTNEYSAGDIVLTPGAGGVTRTTVLEITGADLAERFPTSHEVEPGMVVAIDPDNPGSLCLARGAYNRCVAGVVSGANDFHVGAVLGNLPGHEDAPPIALSGRVYVWCDAALGAIGPGDLLTSSDTAGHAMKATDRDRSNGAIIGKAMTNLSEGKGLVLVLVNLQ